MKKDGIDRNENKERDRNRLKRNVKKSEEWKS